MSHGKPVTEQGAAPRGAARLAGAGPLQCRLETEAIGPRSGPALLSPRADPPAVVCAVAAEGFSALPPGQLQTVPQVRVAPALTVQLERV